MQMSERSAEVANLASRLTWTGVMTIGLVVCSFALVFDTTYQNHHGWAALSFGGLFLTSCALIRCWSIAAGKKTNSAAESAANQRTSAVNKGMRLSSNPAPVSARSSTVS
jgi:uncharacterized membrane protein